jgi:phosphoglycolate phosphatase
MSALRDLSGWTLAFDLDGTLIDTAPDLIATANATLERHGYHHVTADVLRPEISFGSRRMLEVALDRQGVQLDAPALDAMWNDYLNHYRSNLANHSAPFPGLIPVLERAASDGARIVVCTNKLEQLSRRLFAALDLTDRFDAIAGRDTYPVCKPDPYHLVQAIRDGGGDIDRAVMVGDSDTDVSTAKAAGIPVIGVTFGYTAIPVTDLECDAVISDYGDFDKALAGIIANRTS